MKRNGKLEIGAGITLVVAILIGVGASTYTPTPMGLFPTTNVVRTTNWLLMVTETNINGKTRLVQIGDVLALVAGGGGAETNQVLTNLINTVARNVTNAQILYFDIVNGTLFLTSGSLSNLAATRAITNVSSSFGVLASDILYAPGTISLTNITTSGHATFGGNVTNKNFTMMEGDANVVGGLTVQDNSQFQDVVVFQNVITVGSSASAASVTSTNVLTLKNGPFESGLNAITYAATVYVDLYTNLTQTITLTGNITLHTTNRAASVSRDTTLFLTASGADRVVTLHKGDGTEWTIFGTNANSFTVLSGKKAFVALKSIGANETDVQVLYDHAQ
jgi:hypothetical protein